ncbi:MAG: aldo/keto reductase [Candidatus Wallbacteria bacterium HGW-Wallbacteria-1]|jgi:predicted aldo/keto reductase-like oxidoreductase|uniref:Aldo/keto reductase n=1 Tax=Candidatus Wallbacteria bacterium HGW-Wallbacteria-1 TaxID=2013854 RepID=A0A2N1PPR9_9BACT|nr:MAG: aldo/keto reductase [Candidatus Wallbacteria bacterium HGW-Wallbacteria-1]
MARISRGEFLKMLSIGAAAALTGHNPLLAATSEKFRVKGVKGVNENITESITSGQKLINGMPHRALGKTGEYVSILGLGGFHICLDSHTDESAVNLMRRAIDGGVSFFENSREYNGGLAERRMGMALKGSYRDRVFLTTKNCAHDRSGKGALKSLEESLTDLGTDRIDLWMFHEVIYDNDPGWIMEKGGLEAALKAREQGKVRYIGFSGHKHPDIHLDLISRYSQWDAVMMPLNVFDTHFRSFEKLVMPVLLENQIGVVAMKSLCGFMSDMLYKTGFDAADCMRFVFNLPVSTVVSGMESLEQLEKNMATARDFKPMSVSELNRIIELSRPHSGDGRFEKYKTTTFLDGDRGKIAHCFK